MKSQSSGALQAALDLIDWALSKQIDDLHHPEFQQLESAWRGLHDLVCNTQTDELSKIRVMDISKADLNRTLRRHRGVMWDTTFPSPRP